MKNLLIYISNTGSFDNGHTDLINDALPLVKVQIENSLALGWKAEDIMLITNFDFQYGVIKATVLKDVEFFNRKPQASKFNAIIKLFENSLIKRGELYWFHDLDAFQLQPLTKSEINLGKADMGLTDYGRWTRWSAGSIFFKASSEDIFYRIKEIMYRDSIDEEKALGILTRDDKKIKSRVKKLNKSYNFTPPNLRICYKIAKKPIRVAHFHPLGEIKKLGIKKSLDFFMGENKLHIPLITERLIKIFKYHRIR